MLCPAAALLVGLLAATNPSAVDAACPQSCMCTVCHAVADSLNFQLIGRVSSHVDEAHAVDHVKHVLDTVCTVLKYDRLLETAPAPCDSCEAADLARMCLSALRADRMEWQGLLVEHVDPRDAKFERPVSALELCDRSCRKPGGGAEEEAGLRVEGGGVRQAAAAAAGATPGAEATRPRRTVESVAGRRGGRRGESRAAGG